MYQNNWLAPRFWLDACAGFFWEIHEKLTNDPTLFHFRSPDNYGLLHLAAKGKFEVGTAKVADCKWLLENGVEINTVADDGRTPLMEAVKWGNDEVVSYLLEAGAEVYHTDEEGRSVLHEAGIYGFRQIYDLLSTFLELNDKKDVLGLTPSQYLEYSHLVKAIKNNECKMISEMLAKNPEFLRLECQRHRGGLSGCCPLHIASEIGAIELAKLFVRGDADLNRLSSSGFAPIHFAAMRNHKDLVKYLLDEGADVNLLTKSELQRVVHTSTSLHIAAEGGKLAIAKILLKFGADVNAYSSGGTPLTRAVGWSPRKNPMIKLLLANGADVNIHSPEGTSNLYWAKDCDPSTTDLLLKAGANWAPGELKD